MISFPLVFIFPPFQIFLTAFFQLHCYSVSCTGCPSSVNQGNKGPPPPCLPTRCVEKVKIVSYPLDFFSLFQMFSHSIFQLNCYSVGGWVLLFFIFIPPISSQFYHVLCFNLTLPAKTKN
jgi:hypothetical protein